MQGGRRVVVSSNPSDAVFAREFQASVCGRKRSHHLARQVVGDWAKTVLQKLEVSSKAFFELIEENITEVRSTGDLPRH